MSNYTNAMPPAPHGHGYSNGKRVSSQPMPPSGPIGPPPGMPPKRKPVKRVPVPPQTTSNNNGASDSSSSTGYPRSSSDSQRSTSTSAFAEAPRPAQRQSMVGSSSSKESPPPQRRRFSESPQRQHQQHHYQQQQQQGEGFQDSYSNNKNANLSYPVEDEHLAQVKPPFMYSHQQPVVPPKMGNKSVEDLRRPQENNPGRKSLDYRNSPPTPSMTPLYQTQSQPQPQHMYDDRYEEEYYPITRTSTANTTQSAYSPRTQQPPQFPSPPQSQTQYQQSLQQQQLQQQIHHRSESVHSESSGTSLSQPLYMNAPPAAPPTLVVPPPQAQAQPQAPPMPSVPQTQAQQLKHQYSVSHSSVYSHSSKLSRGSGSMSNKNSDLGIGTGSNYVKELRKRLATVWCDVPPRNWGLPIGISGKSGNISALGPTKGFQRRAMDIRHSHLQPRLLASEVDDEDEDSLQSPGGTSQQSHEGTLFKQASTVSMNNGSAAKTSHEDSSKSRASSINEQTLDSESKPTTGTNSSQQSTRQRADSGSSTKSVEEDVGKIKLFVANPDSDTD